MTHAAYARVSGDEQKEAQTIRTQEEALQRHAASLGLTLTLYADEGIDGSVPLELRPGGKRLWDAVTAGQVKTILVYRLDRLSRDQIMTLTLLRRFAALGVGVVSLTENLDLDTPSGWLMTGIHAGFAEYEKAVIRERTMNGRQRKAREGVIPTSLGQANRIYGYEREGVTLKIVESEAAVVRHIFAEFVSGASLGALARDLNAAAVLTVRGYPWGRESVRNLLLQPAYMGEYRYGRDECRITGELTRGGKKRYKLKPAPSFIAVPVPAIIDADLWERAQQRFVALLPGRPSSTWLLRGIVFCGTCTLQDGRPMGCHGNRRTRNAKHRTYEERWYACNSEPRADLTFCGARYPAADLEALVATAAAEWTAPGVLARKARQDADAARRASDPAADVKRLVDALASLDREEGRLIDLREEGWSLAALEPRRRSIQQRRQAAEQQLAEASRLAAALPDPEDAAILAENRAAQARGWLGSGDPELIRRAYLCLLRVYITKGEAPEVVVL